MGTSANAAVTFPVTVKEEPASDSESEEFPFPNHTPQQPHRWENPGKRPKPTWSLKELSDDEGEISDHAEDFSEYEPSSDSDSDCEGNKSTSSAYKRIKISLSSAEGSNTLPTVCKRVPPSTGIYQKALQVNPRSEGSPTPYKLYPVGLKTPPSTTTHSQSGHFSKSKNEKPNAATPYGKLIYLIHQLQEINVTSGTDLENYDRCTSVFDNIFRQLRNLKNSSNLASVITNQLRLLADVIRRRKAQGNSVANQVHFSLICKKLIELVQSSMSHSSGLRNIQKQKQINPKTINKEFSPGSGLSSFLNKKFTHPSASPVQTNCSSKVRGLSALSSSLQSSLSENSNVLKSVSDKRSETPIFTVEDDDNFPLTIKSVTTLSGDSRNYSNISSSFEHMIQTILKGEIPPPVCKDRENEISWMGYPVDDEENEDLYVIDDSISAFAPGYPLCKYPPNVPLTFAPVGSKSNPDVRPTIGNVSHPFKIVGPNAFSNRLAKAVLPREVKTAVPAPVECPNSPFFHRSNPVSTRLPLPTPAASPVVQGTAKLLVKDQAEEIIVISDSDEEDCNPVKVATPNQPSTGSALRNTSAVNVSAPLGSSAVTVTAEELVLGL